MVPIFSPNGASVSRQGREPLGDPHTGRFPRESSEPQRGDSAQVSAAQSVEATVAPLGLGRSNGPPHPRGLRPWLRTAAPLGLKMGTAPQSIMSLHLLPVRGPMACR